MNQYGQQMNQNQYGQQNKNQYQPSGFVQSHYQGIPKQTNSISAMSNVGPVLSHFGGYQAQNTQQQQYGQQQSFAQQQQQFNQQHYGQQQQFNQQQQFAQPYQATTHYVQQAQPVVSHFSTMNGQSGYGMKVGNNNSMTSGWKSGMNSGVGAMQSHTPSYVTNYTSQAGNNPVLQSVNYANQGAIVSKTGYSANGYAPSSMAYNNQQC